MESNLCQLISVQNYSCSPNVCKVYSFILMESNLCKLISVQNYSCSPNVCKVYSFITVNWLLL